MPASFKDFADFEQRMMRPTFADHRIDDAKRAAVGAAFAPHLRADGAHFTRPMHARAAQSGCQCDDSPGSGSGGTLSKRTKAWARLRGGWLPAGRFNRCMTRCNE